jgi:uncharacterized protein involved in outer membrane biogenesis
MKIFLRSALGLVVLALAGLLVVVLLFWGKLPGIASDHISKLLKVPVEISRINLSPRAINVHQLEIGNPQGYILPYAFTAHHIAINAPLTHYFRNNLEIDEIDVNDIYLGLEFDSPSSTRGNWTAIVHNAKRAQDPSTGTQKSVLIRRIVLTNIRTDLVYRTQAGQVRRLPVIKRLELTNISSSGGGDVMDQIMNSALGEMLKQVFIEQNLKDLLDNVFQNIPNNFQNNIPSNLPLKGLFNTAPWHEEAPPTT